MSFPAALSDQLSAPAQLLAEDPEVVVGIGMEYGDYRAVHVDLQLVALADVGLDLAVAADLAVVAAVQRDGYYMIAVDHDGAAGE